MNECLAGGKLSGDGAFTKACHDLLATVYGSTVLLVHSCTAALELAGLLADLKAGDEVIMPSFTFVSTANSVVLRGAVPVFVDIRPDTLNIDETKIEAAITDRTRAIIPVHYAGVSAEMNAINAIARRHGLFVIEDAAQGFGATYHGTPLGALSDIGCLSFHDTKNIVAGEGGAVIIKNQALAERAQYIREKGTNRTQYLRREVTKYEWIDVGSSFLPSDLLAAVLLAQLQRSDKITQRRMAIWQRYQAAFASLQNFGIRVPAIPSNVSHNGHIYYLVMPDAQRRQTFIELLRADGIVATSHYVPLHSAPAGRRFSRAAELPVTDWIASSIVRLPMFSQLADDDVDYVIERALVHLDGIFASPSA